MLRKSEIMVCALGTEPVDLWPRGSSLVREWERDRG